MTPVRIELRVRPGASRTRVGGRYGDGGALVVAVNARAVDGAATEAALKAVAQALEVHRRDVRLVTGASSRTKLIEVDGDPQALAARLKALLGT